MKSYRVKSIFGPTIQGEGTHAGTCVMFVRFAGCNRWTGLAKDKELSFCKFCDTDFRDGTPLTAVGIVAQLQLLSRDCKVVVLSGGEPSLQVNQELIDALYTNGYEIHLETNGSRDIYPWGDHVDHITVSPKQPIGETKLSYAHALKLLYPLPDPKMDPETFAAFPARDYFLQPVMDDNYEANLKATVEYIKKHPHWRLSLQTHKIIGVE